MTEEEIIEGCQHGDNRSRKELYEQYSATLFALVLRYQPDRDKAQDVLHDGFISVYTHINKFSYRGEGSLKAWLSQIFVNEVLTSLRAKDILATSVDIEDVRTDFTEPDADETAQIPADKIYEVVSKLPDGYRTVFNLFAIEGLSHKEIGEMLNISQKTSASQFYRARTIVARELKKFINEKHS